MTKLSVVIPAHDEEASLGACLDGLTGALQRHRIPYEVVLVDDASTDGTSDHPDDVVAYYRKIEEGYDCVFGSRFVRGSSVEHYPLVKLVANRIVNRLIQALFWTRYNDLTNAFKAYRADVIRECGPYRASHFNITIEMSLGALIRGYSIAQIPIRWSGRTWGSSKLKLREMGRRYLCVLLKTFFEKVLVADDLVAERAARHPDEAAPAAGSGDGRAFAPGRAARAPELRP